MNVEVGRYPHFSLAVHTVTSGPKGPRLVVPIGMSTFKYKPKTLCLLL
jgi:hypothetical protein